MASKIPTNQFLRAWPRMKYATKAATNPSPSRASSLPKQEPKLSTLPNGVVVASVENYNPIARVSVIVKAGPRYETGDNLGITHALRNYADLSARDASTFGIVQNIQQIGGSLTASATRELLSYTVECNRDNLDVGLNFLAQASTKQVFKPWEVKDSASRLKVDLAVLKNTPEAIVLEQLHKAAFRTGLGNSLFSPGYLVGKHSPSMLKDYVKHHFTANKMTVVGVGVPHDILVEYVNKMLQPNTEKGTAEVPTKYGGGEIRIIADLPISCVAVATEGASLKDTKDALSLAVLQNIMGVGPRMKYSSGVTGSRLAQAAVKATDKPFAISALNLNYSDSGLFGFFCIAQPKDMNKVLKEIFAQYSLITKSGVKDEEVKRAKHQLQATLHLAVENASDLHDELGVQAALLGRLFESSELDKAIESITPTDVKSIAKKVVNGKPSMAAVGNLSHTPYLDQLM